MRKARELIDMPILFLQEGLDTAGIRTLAVDPETLQTRYLAISDGSWYGPMALVPFEKVMAIGPDLVTVRTVEDTDRSTDIPTLQQLTPVWGIRAVDDMGAIRGRVQDFIIDERTGRVDAFLLEDGSQADSSRIVLLAPHLLVIRAGKNMS
ncbi:MAG: hypothetical protein GX549_00005 [Clostridiales bacterium]|nr:hypothetical protein [Clostridiales bacterium]